MRRRARHITAIVGGKTVTVFTDGPLPAVHGLTVEERRALTEAEEPEVENETLDTE